MEISKQIEEFNSAKLMDLIKEANENVEQLTKEQDELEVREKPNKRALSKLQKRFISEAIRYASLILEQYNTEWMTTNPGNMNEDNVYQIIEKKTPNKWVLEIKGEKTAIYRGKNGLFKLNGDYIYNCYPLDQEEVEMDKEEIDERK